MVRLPVIAAALILPGLALAQPTDDAAKCQAAAGSYLTGTVVSGPRFKPGAPLHGTFLSHTHLTLRGDADGRTYDVAIDNVFADGYRHNQRSVPAPLNTIKVGDRLELCGKLYTGRMSASIGCTRIAARPRARTSRMAGCARSTRTAVSATTWKPSRISAPSGRTERIWREDPDAFRLFAADVQPK
jgi:hypothetical protein